MPSPYTILYYIPHVMAVIFLFVLMVTPIRDKAPFFWRAAVALAIACFLAHVNRIFHLYPDYLYFPSGHMTFCLGISVSLALLQPWTPLVTLPVVVIMGEKLVEYDCHTTLDVLGAIPLVLIVYGTVHYLWRMPIATRPLDRASPSL